MQEFAVGRIGGSNIDADEIACVTLKLTMSKPKNKLEREFDQNAYVRTRVLCVYAYTMRRCCAKNFTVKDYEPRKRLTKEHELEVMRKERGEAVFPDSIKYERRMRRFHSLRSVKEVYWFFGRHQETKPAWLRNPQK